MNFWETERLANDLMRHFGMLELGWKFRWSNGKRTLGSASWKRNRRAPGVQIPNHLNMSGYLVQLNGADEVYVPLAEQGPDHKPGHIEDTIRHEIAHMIAGHAAGHGPIWKAAAVRCGADPRRCADESVKMPKAAYEIVCTCCNKVIGKRHKRVRLGTKFHPKCGRKSVGQLVLRYAA